MASPELSFSPTLHDEVLSPQTTCIGYGSYGAVYKDAPSSLTVFKSSLRWVVYEGHERRLIKDPESTAIREAIILSTLRHPHIVPVTNVQLTKQRIHLHMPYKGVPLSQWVDLHTQQKRVAWFWRIMYQLIDSVTCLIENGIQHIDLRPENVLVSADEQGLPFVTLIDLGLCSVKTSKMEWSDGIGCWVCCPPEILIPDRYVHNHTTMWPIALLGAYILLGYNPTYHHMKKKTHAADAADTLRFLQKWVQPGTHVPLKDKEAQAMMKVGSAWITMFRRMTQWFPCDRPSWSQITTFFYSQKPNNNTYTSSPRPLVSDNHVSWAFLKEGPINTTHRHEIVSWIYHKLYKNGKNAAPFSFGVAVYILDGFLLRAIAADCLVLPSDLRIAAVACIIISIYMTNIHSEGMVAKWKTTSQLTCSTDELMRWIWDVCRVWEWKCWALCPMVYAPFDNVEDNEKELLRHLLNVKSVYTPSSIWMVPYDSAIA
jgi:serine/threonine protein kinase